MTLEYSTGDGKKVDILVERNRKHIAIEIETENLDSAYIMKKNLKARFLT